MVSELAGSDHTSEHHDHWTSSARIFSDQQQAESDHIRAWEFELVTLAAGSFQQTTDFLLLTLKQPLPSIHGSSRCLHKCWENFSELSQIRIHSFPNQLWLLEGYDSPLSSHAQSIWLCGRHNSVSSHTSAILLQPAVADDPKTDPDPRENPNLCCHNGENTM